MASLQTARRLLTSNTSLLQTIHHPTTGARILSTLTTTTTWRTLSTAPHQTKNNFFELPPNLKFDPRVKASPFYGAEKVDDGGSKEKRKKDKTTTVKKVEPTAEASSALPSNDNVEPVDHEQYEDDYTEEDDVTEKILYDLSTAQKPKFSIPLPHRLHVNVMDLKTSGPIGTLHLSPQTFGLSPVRVDILHRVVVYQRNKKRGKRNAGARTKTISEVSGSGRKVRRQKGMGMARAGHSRPAHWRGGAKAHGPKGAIQDYTTKLNKKVRKLGVRHALSQKLLEGNLVVLDHMNLESHKTRRLEEMVARFGVGKNMSSALFIDDAEDAVEDFNDGEKKQAGSVYGGLNVNFKVASGNLQKIKVLNQLGCNVYDMLKFEKLFLTLSAVRALEERLQRDLWEILFLTNATFT